MMTSVSRCSDQLLFLMKLNVMTRVMALGISKIILAVQSPYCVNIISITPPQHHIPSHSHCGGSLAV